MKYIYPKFSSVDFGFVRFGGVGLGNLLSIFARALITAHENDYQVIWPTWPSIKVGPWIRREKDKRFYGDLFKSNCNYVTGLTKAKLLLCSKKYLITNENAGNELPELPDKGVYEYSAFSMRFKDIISYRDYLREKIVKITKDKHKRYIEHDFTNEINVHVRLGDFAKPNAEQASKEIFNTQLPIEWYVKAINDIIAVLGDSVRFNIFSDGADDELKPILDIPQCSRMFWGSAIADILALSQSKVIIASGSSFSLWARFLGNRSCLTFSNQLFEKVCEGEGKFEYDYGFDEGLSEYVIECLEKEYCNN